MKANPNALKWKFAVAAAAASAALAFAEGVPQTECPVMEGMPVDRHSPYVDALGYRIYVCCGSCVFDVKDDPAKYLGQMKAAGIEPEKSPAPPAADESH